MSGGVVVPHVQYGVQPGRHDYDESGSTTDSALPNRDLNSVEVVYVMGAFQGIGSPSDPRYWLIKPLFEPGGSRLRRYARARRKKRADDKRKREEDWGFIPGVGDDEPEWFNSKCKESIRWLRMTIVESGFAPLICRNLLCPHLTEEEMETILKEDYGVNPNQLGIRGRGPRHSCDLFCNLVSYHDVHSMISMLEEVCQDHSVAFGVDVLALKKKYKMFLP